MYHSCLHHEYPSYAKQDCLNRSVFFFFFDSHNVLHTDIRIVPSITVIASPVIKTRSPDISSLSSPPLVEAW